MPKVIIDVSDVPDSDRATYDGPTPKTGLYKAVFKRAWWTKTNDKSKTMLKVLFTLETDHPEKKQFNGYPMWHNVTYEPSTDWKMKELFVALNAGLKAAIDYDDKGVVTRIGRAIPGRSYVLIHGKTGYWKNQERLEIDTLAPVPRKEGEEDIGEEPEWDEGEATPYEEAGGISADETATSDGGSQWRGSDVGDSNDPWAAPPGDDEPPF